MGAPTPTEPPWFWTEQWQTGEAEAAADLAAGRVETFADHAAMLAALD